jgi:putative tryptophan/tyrosine transport system substrate-binding protein
MRRRQFATLGVAGAGLLVLGTNSRAQQSPSLPRIGWIWHGRSAGPPEEMTGFRQGLQESGYVDGQNVIVDYRFTEGQPDRIVGLAAELIQMRPDVMVVLGLLTMDAIKDATGNIPVVLLTGDPVGAGYVASLARPGGHITGVSLMQGAGGLTGKRIELLKDALPAATRIGLLFNPEYSIAAASIEQAQQVASGRGLAVVPAPVRQVNEIDAAIAKLANEHVHAVDVEPGAPILSYQQEIGGLLLQYRIPAVSELRLLIESGGLISYGPSIFESARRMAYFVDRILKGAKPADLPVEQASKLELVINMKTARLLGIELPPNLLARADEVIE